jgi:hypothetical protein
MSTKEEVWFLEVSVFKIFTRHLYKRVVWLSDERGLCSRKGRTEVVDKIDLIRNGWKKIN